MDRKVRLLFVPTTNKINIPSSGLILAHLSQFRE
jgi:hypothetical protein